MALGMRAKDQERNPERLLQLKRICDMLLAAGYFRARIPMLSPFDKVVGGLVWGITASNVNLDVDIIFQENSTIGERVRVSEQIVKALVRMKCPHPLQPQQIQGLDYPPLFKATQWLVSRVIETRAETQLRMRNQAEFSFSKTLQFEEDENCSGPFLQRALSANAPQRKYKKQEGADIRSLIASAEATLLEFGERFYNSATFGGDGEGKAKKKKTPSSSSSDFQKMRSKLAAAQGGDASSSSGGSKKGGESKENKEDEKRQEELRKQMAEVKEGAGVSASGVGALILDNEEQIKAAMQQYEEASQAASALEASAGGGKRGLQQQFKRLESALMRQLEELKASVQEIKGDYDSKKAALSEARGRKRDQDAKHEKLVEVLNKLEEKESNVENKQLLQKLRALVTLNEMLKRQEKAFKENCQKQREELEAKLKALKSGEDDEQTKRMLEIERLYENDLSKYNKLRGLLAKKNINIARVQRSIDAIPTRAELLQYQRRFVELYELVSNKLVETRKYFELYNMLEEKHRYMVNEVDLLNSIGKSVPKLMTSSSGKDQLGKNFQSILSNMDKTQDSVQNRFQGEKTKCDTLNDKHKKMLMKQRKYFQAVKEFQEECYKNEKLSAAVEQYAGDEDEEDEGEPPVEAEE
eukprot:CAMPEP_0114507390 /NCGR_PEP_ID=MMETSP0109-20121206/11984_1 /TAXON_ID=29199 /ORGANISM="Chlorarachnion reptans, Strain CCCM449" /LENGTH=640 /DNA_ID=CAMNT_0001686139 /DNA_START=37 /DNA_END=1959 /DNA_ORIENTATION=-